MRINKKIYWWGKGQEVNARPPLNSPPHNATNKNSTGILPVQQKLKVRAVSSSYLKQEPRLPACERKAECLFSRSKMQGGHCPPKFANSETRFTEQIWWHRFSTCAGAGPQFTPTTSERFHWPTGDWPGLWSAASTGPRKTPGPWSCRPCTPPLPWGGLPKFPGPGPPTPRRR